MEAPVAEESKSEAPVVEETVAEVEAPIVAETTEVTPEAEAPEAPAAEDNTEEKAE